MAAWPLDQRLASSRWSGMLKPLQRLAIYINCSVVPGWPLPKLPSVQVSETNNNKKLYEWIKSQQIKSVRG